MSTRRLDQVEAELRSASRVFLVTGGAGFIGSHLVGRLLSLGQRVRVLDNFMTGHRRNLDEAVEGAGRESSSRLEVLEGDIRNLDVCRRASEGVDVVLHQAALGSVPRSIADPLSTHSVNVDGFANVLVASREAGVKRFVYASSGSVYGDDVSLRKVEDRTGRPLSPYAASKAANEALAASFRSAYGLSLVGLRYFNVFGERQDPAGPYAAVIPRWIDALAHGGIAEIYGDGRTTRDFCYVANVVEANLLSASRDAATGSDVYNVALGETTSLESLFRMIRERVAGFRPDAARAEVRHGPFRAGDIRHSSADISRAHEDLGYAPMFRVGDGLDRTVEWFLSEQRAGR